MQVTIPSKKKVCIYATSRYSLYEISVALRSLKVSHTIDPEAKHRPVKVVDLGYEQPLPVRLSPRVSGYCETGVNFISASVAELKDTNFTPFHSGSLAASLRAMLVEQHKITPTILSRDANSYVDSLAKPSMLNHLQTEVYKIQPYALRKEVQALVLEYFNSKISIKSAKQQLQRSMKTERFVKIFQDMLPLRLAVAELKTKPVELVEKETGFSAFELLYLTKAKIVKEPKSSKKESR
jgi:hypothetical protein